MARRTNVKKAKKARPSKVTRPSYKTLYEQEVAARGQDIRNMNFEINKLRGAAFRWRTRDGRTLAPSEMDESHLRNTISFLQRHLVYAFGNVTYVDETASRVEALHEMLKEAKARSLRV